MGAHDHMTATPRQLRSATYLVTVYNRAGERLVGRVSLPVTDRPSVRRHEAIERALDTSDHTPHHDDTYAVYYVSGDVTYDDIETTSPSTRIPADRLST